MPVRRKKRARPAASLALAGLAWMTSAAGAATPEQIGAVRAGAAEARRESERLIHFDTQTFEPCVGALVDKAKLAPFTQLGILYGGYVSVMNYAHGGLPGARPAAWRLLQRLSPLQKRLGVDARALCETVAGNCEIRVAATEAMLQAAPPAPSKLSDSHRH